jgi:hypothetical protein
MTSSARTSGGKMMRILSKAHKENAARIRIPMIDQAATPARRSLSLAGKRGSGGGVDTSRSIPDGHPNAR